MESVVLLVMFFGGILADIQIPLSLPALAEDDTISNLQLLIPMQNSGASKNVPGNVVMVLETPSTQDLPKLAPVPPLTPLLVERSPSLILSDDDDDDRNEVARSRELLDFASSINSYNAGLNSLKGDEVDNGMILLSSRDSVEEEPAPPNNVVAERNLKSSLQYLCASLLAREQIILAQSNESLRRNQEAHLPPTLIRTLCRSYLQSLSEIKGQEKPQPPSAPFRNLNNLKKLKNFYSNRFSSLNSLNLNKQKKKQVLQPVYKQFESPKQGKTCSICEWFHQHVADDHLKGNVQVFGGTGSEEDFRGHGSSCSVCQLIRQMTGQQGRQLNRHRRATLVGEEYPGMFQRAARAGFLYKLKKRGDLRSSFYPLRMIQN